MSRQEISGARLLKRVKIICGTDCLPTSFADLKVQGEDQKEGGFLYVAAFANGLIKVGRAWNPQSRLSTHAITAEVWGSKLTQAWVSQRVWNHGPVERQLIAWCADHYTAIGATEYCRGGDFDDIVERAVALCIGHAPPTRSNATTAARLRMFTVAEVVKETGLSEYGVRQAIKVGELGHRRIGRSIYVPAVALDAFYGAPPSAASGEVAS